MKIRVIERTNGRGDDFDYIFFDELPNSIMDKIIYSIRAGYSNDCQNEYCVINTEYYPTEYQVRALFDGKDLTIDNEIKQKKGKVYILDIGNFLVQEENKLEREISKDFVRIEAHLSDLKLEPAKKDANKILKNLKKAVEDLGKIKLLRGEK